MKKKSDSKLRLGEALMQAGVIDEIQLKSALGHQRQWGGKLGKSLIELGFIDEPLLIKFLSEKLNFPAVDLSRSKIAKQTFDALPKKIAEKYNVAPLIIKDTPGKKTMVLAMSDPTDLRAIDEIEFVTNFRIEPVVAIESAIQKVLMRYGEESEEDTAESIVMEDYQPAGMEVIQGDLDQLQEVTKSNSSIPMQSVDVSASGSFPEAVTASPGSEKRMEDFGIYSDDDVEEAAAEENDEPLEMITDEDSEGFDEAEVIEEAETVEDAEIVAEEAELVEDAGEVAEVGQVAGDPEEDPYEYAETGDTDIPEQDTVAEGYAIEDPSPSAEEDRVSVVDSLDQLEALAGGGAGAADDTVEEVGEVAEAEPVRTTEYEEVSDDGTGEVWEAEPVEAGDYTSTEAGEGAVEEPAEVADVEEVAEAGEISDPEYDYVESAEPVEEAESIQAAEEMDAKAEAIVQHEEDPFADAPKAFETQDEFEAPTSAPEPGYSAEAGESSDFFATEDDASSGADGQPAEVAEYAEYAGTDESVEEIVVADAAPVEEDDTGEEYVAAEAEPIQEQSAGNIDEIQEMKKQLAKLAGKIEGLVSLFILKEQGLLSVEEFIEELKVL